MYEGKGGPLDKIAQRDGGINDNDVVPANVPKAGGGGSQDIADKGAEAAAANARS